MSQTRVPIMLAAVLACSLVALSAPSAAVRANPPAEAIKADTHRLAHDVNREALLVGHRVKGDAHQLRGELVTARERVSLQLHQIGHRIQRWWSRVRAS